MAVSAIKYSASVKAHSVYVHIFSERVVNCWKSLLNIVDFSSFIHVSRVLLSVSISHNLRDFKSVNSLLYAIFAFVLFLFLRRSTVTSCYVPSVVLFTCQFTAGIILNEIQ